MKNKTLFLLLCIVLVAISIANKMILRTDELFLNSISDQLTKAQVDKIFELNQKWQWLAYVFIPVLQLIKISLISCALYTGIFFFDIKLSFKKLFHLVTKAEFIFVAVGIIKLIWLALLGNITIDDIQYFYPLSALNIVGLEGTSPWFIYPLQIINLFELAYWLVLSYLIGKAINVSTDRGLKIVASSYGIALLVWVVLIMFFTLNAN